MAWVQDCNCFLSARMLDCCHTSMVMEEFSGMQVDRSVFDFHPAGTSQVHLPSGDLHVEFLQTSSARRFRPGDRQEPRCTTRTMS